MSRIKNRRNLFIGGSFVAVLAALGIGQAMLDKTVAAQTAGATMAPRFEVDPLWPKPLPNHWVIGSTVGVTVDSRDHVWIIHTRSSLNDREAKAGVLTPIGECCTPAPPVLEFDSEGNLVGSWGGPG